MLSCGTRIYTTAAIIKEAAAKSMGTSLSFHVFLSLTEKNLPVLLGRKSYFSKGFYSVCWMA
jgi:hypothetical protein